MINRDAERLAAIEAKRTQRPAPEPLSTDGIGRTDGVFQRYVRAITRRSRAIEESQGRDAALVWLRAEKARHNSGRGTVLDDEVSE